MPKISSYPDGGAVQATDQFVIARAGHNKSILGSNVGGGAPPATGLPVGHLFGLTLSNNVADATNDIDIAVGKCRNLADTGDMTLAAGLTKRLDAAWGVGTNQGGLDTGAIANTTYHVWLIKRTDTGVVDALFSASATAPTMPANYDQKRRIGSIVRLAAVIKPFIQDGDDFMWRTPVNDLTATNPGTAAVTRTLTVPVGIRVKARLSIAGMGLAAGAHPHAVYISDLSLDDIAVEYDSGFSVYIYGSPTDLRLGDTDTVYTNTAAQVRSRQSVSNANTVLYINTHGWIDTRGRLA